MVSGASGLGVCAGRTLLPARKQPLETAGPHCLFVPRNRIPASCQVSRSVARSLPASHASRDSNPLRPAHRILGEVEVAPAAPRCSRSPIRNLKGSVRLHRDSAPRPAALLGTCRRPARSRACRCASAGSPARQPPCSAAARHRVVRDQRVRSSRDRRPACVANSRHPSTPAQFDLPAQATVLASRTPGAPRPRRRARREAWPR